VEIMTLLHRSAGRRVPAPALAVGSMLSVQLGTALAKPVFPVLGPAGTAWMRLVWAGVFLLVVARPRVRGRHWRDLGAVAVLGLASAGLTVLFFEAVARIPLGIAATVEFLGPLAVAVATSHRRVDILWSLCAAAGVASMSSAALSGGSSRDWPAGLACALGAAACWAAYIVFTKHVGARWSGVEGLSMSMTVAALVAAPLGIVQAAGGLTVGSALVTAGLALLLPILPYTLEMAALRRMHVRAFSVLMSAEPVFAALIGLVLLGQLLSAPQWLGVVLVVLANVAVSARAEPE
jgi:inner membrane transporter RhtA